MSVQFVIYGAIVLVASLIALIVVKPRNAFDLSRCVGWYILLFATTYVVRPALSELVGDYSMYQWLQAGYLEDHWELMAVAGSLAIVCFGIGYASGRPSRRLAAVAENPAPEPTVNPRLVRRLIVCLLFIGYLSALFVLKYGGGDETLHARTATMGTYEHGTAWFSQDDLLISCATVLYYIATGRLGISLLLAGPWLGLRVLSGWGRTNLIGHFFALMSVYFLKRRKRERVAGKTRQALVIGCGVVSVLVLFPLMGMLRGLRSELGGSAKDAIMMVRSTTDPGDVAQTYFGTNSPVSGFELTLSHLVNDKRSELGTQYLYYFFFQPIPRIIWPGKGSPYSWPEKLRGIEVDPLLGIIGAAPGSIGMAFEQWGWLGIPLEFILTGLIIRRWEEAARRRPKALHVQLSYAGLCSLVPQLGRDSLFYMISQFWLFKFGIAVFILWIIYRSELARSGLRTTSARVFPVPPAPAAAKA